MARVAAMMGLGLLLGCADAVPPSASAGAGAIGAACAEDLQCQAGLRCVDGRCAPAEDAGLITGDAEALQPLDAAPDGLTPDAGALDGGGPDVAPAADLGPEDQQAEGVLAAGSIRPFTAATWLGGRPAVAWTDAEGVHVAVGLRDAPRLAEDWHRQTVATGAGLRDVALATVDGRPALAWYDGGRGALMFAMATKPQPVAPSDWAIYPIDQADNPGQFVRLAVVPPQPAVPAGAVFMAWYVAGTGDLRFARALDRPPLGRGDWEVEVVADAGDVGLDLDLRGVVDAQDGVRPVLAWRDASAHALVWAQRLGGTWRAEPVPGADPEALALGATGQRVVWRGTDGAVHSGTRDGAGWQTTVVDATPGAAADLAVHEGLGPPRITWRQTGARAIYHALPTGDAERPWQAAMVETPVAVDGGLTVLPLPCGPEDAEDGRHHALAFWREGETGALRFAPVLPEPRSAWFRHRVSTPVSAAALLPGEAPAAAWTDGIGLRFGRATRTDPTDSGDWRVHTLAPGAVAEAVFVARLADGRPVVAWQDVIEGPRVAVADAAAPATPGAWTHTAVALEGEAIVALLVLDDRPVVIARQGEAGRVSFAHAVRATPTEPADWRIHRVEEAGQPTVAAAAAALPDGPALVLARANGAIDWLGARGVPTASQDWRGHRPVGGPGPWTGVGVGTFGNGAALMATGRDLLRYLRTGGRWPEAPAEWSAHTVGTAVKGRATLGDLEGRPGVLYAAAYASGPSLRLATTGVPRPGAQAAWSVARVDALGPGAAPFRPEGLSVFDGRVGLLYEAGACLTYGWPR